MNKIKRTLRKPLTPVKKDVKQPNKKLWVIIGSVLSVILVAALLFDQLYKRPIITLEGEKYYLEDLGYYFFEVESQYDSMTSLFGANYWDMSFDGSSTVRDMALEEAVNNSLTNEVLYLEAISEGYSITDEDKTDAAENLKTLTESYLTAEVKEKAGFTDEYLTEQSEKVALLNRFREDKIASFGIDAEALRATVNYDEFRQYDIETVFISTQSTDAEGNAVDKTAEEKDAALEKIKLLHETGKTTEDWSTLVPEGDEELTYAERSFIESNSTFSEDYTKIVLALENGGITDVYEEEAGYYFVRMVNNDSNVSYENEVETVITTEENNKFNEYIKTATEKYDYKIHNGGLRPLSMGNITLP